MGAKKQPQEKSKKAANKEKEKIIEDKTFGLKNKNKSATVQKYIKGVSQQVKGMPKGGERAQIESKLQDKEEKKKSAADSALLASLFKSVVNLPKDQDAKSIICSYFKQGMCQKGDKCKFSHDLSSLPVQQEKPDLYHDPRPNVQNNDITCEFFFNAVRDEKFGWFWKCPNGNECIYRHALPEGFEFKKEEVKVEVDDEDKPTLEEVLDKERSALPTGLKNVNFEEFMSWVEEEKKIREQEKLERTKHLKGISGKALFESNQALFQDDEDAFEDYKRDEEAEQDDDDQDKRFVDESGQKPNEKDEESKPEESKPEESKPEESKLEESKQELPESLEAKT
jgi:hypothetical protein